MPVDRIAAMRVLVLGLDGADRDLVDRLLAEGKLPTLGRLQSRKDPDLRNLLRGNHDRQR